MGKLIVSAAGAAAACAVLTACSLHATGGVPAVKAEDLQADIAHRLAEAGQTPQAVTCKDPLVGEVGQQARCDVVLSPTNSFQPIVTVTGVDRSAIDYEMIPALSEQQLERAVARLVAHAGRAPSSGVECRSGLLGRPGAVAQCDVTAAGVTLRRTAEVTNVDGLMMNFDLVPVLTKAELETSLLDELATHLDKRPDSAVCAGSLEGRPGNTVDCTVMAGSERADFTLTVTTVDGAKIDYIYTPRR